MLNYFSALASLDVSGNFEDFRVHVEVVVLSQFDQQYTEIGTTQVQSQEFTSF